MTIQLKLTAYNFGVKFDWIKISSPCFGPVTKPIARVFLQRTSGDWQEYLPEVDSGAVVSYFNKEDCEWLGLNLEEGVLCKLGGIGGSSVNCYIHKVRMRIGSEELETRIAFSDAPKHDLLLGRLDVFDNFDIDLHGRDLFTNFSRNMRLQNK